MNQPPPTTKRRVPDDDVDISLKPQASRPILTFGKGDAGLRKRLNTFLRGGPGFPVLTAAISIGLGLYSSPAGVAFTAFTAGWDAASGPTSSVLTRPGDEVWFVERVGRDAGQPTHQELYMIRDPYRQKHGPPSTPAAWVIHEARHELRLS